MAGTGCTSSHSVTVTVNPLPGAVAGIDRVTCSGETTVLGAASVGSNTYSWTNNVDSWTSTIANPSVSPTVNTIYTLVETMSGTGCTASHSVTVTVNPLPVPSITGYPSVCSGSVETYSISSLVAGHSYNWTVTGGTPASGSGAYIVITWGSSGTGTVGVTETITATGCSKAANPLNVTINPLPNPSISGEGTVCGGATGVTYSTASVSGHTYSWSVSGGTPTSGTGSNISVTWSNSGSGTVAVTETITASGCSQQVEKYVTINPSLQITAFSVGNDGTGTVGQGATFSVTATGGGTPTYQWYKNSTETLSGKTNASFTISSVSCADHGDYSVKVTPSICGSQIVRSATFSVYSANAPSAATGLLFSTWQKNYIKFNIGTPNGSGSSRLIVAQGTSATSASAAIAQFSWTPTNGLTYSANTTFGTSGTQVPNYGSTIAYAVYNGTATSAIQITNLTNNTWYAFAVFEYTSNLTSGCVSPYYSTGFVKAQNTLKKEFEDEQISIGLADNFILTDISPNPAYNDINFSIITQEKLPVIFEIYSIEGMQVYSEQKEISSGTTPITISLESDKGVLPSGMYILKVRTGNDELTRRFIYMH